MASCVAPGELTVSTNIAALPSLSKKEPEWPVRSRRPISCVAPGLTPTARVTLLAPLVAMQPRVFLPGEELSLTWDVGKQSFFNRRAVAELPCQFQ
jgi:hypothetical protein